MSSFLFVPINASINAVVSDKRILNNKADHQPDTSKPGTISDAHFIMRIFITSRNKPKVRMVMGMVKIMRIGFTTPLSNASTNASKIAVTLFLMLTPGSRRDTIIAASAVTNIFPINFMSYNSEFVKIFSVKIFSCKLQ